MIVHGAALAVLAALLVLAVVLRLPAPERATEPWAPPAGYELLSVQGTSIDEVEALVVATPWCARPITMVFVPAYLSSLDLHAISGPEGDGEVSYLYAGHRLPSVGVGATVAILHLVIRTAGGLRLVPETTAGAYVVKMLTAVTCREAAALRTAEITGQFARLRGEARRRTDQGGASQLQ